MTDGVAVREALSSNVPYFYLSYAYSDPLAGDPESNPDHLVEEFFGHLADAVRQHASRRAGLVPGFYDREIPVGSDWKEYLSQVLGTTQAFVPLYSARYIARSWPGREWTCFRKRVELAGLKHPARRFVPVLWTPLSGMPDPPGLRGALAHARQSDYSENGLRALLMIRKYHDSYQTIVNLIAKQIVALAEKSPIRPSEVPDIDEVESEFMPLTSEPDLSVFTIETAVPTAAAVSAVGHDVGGYGESSTQWRPFPGQELPLAEYASQIAERFDFEPRVSGIKIVRNQGARRPGIILIDPWFIADAKGRSVLESAVKNLPRWVLPVIILDHPDDSSTQKFADQVRDILGAAGVLPAKSRKAAKGVSSLDEFVSMVRILAAEAERQYMRYGGQEEESPPPGGGVEDEALPLSTRPSLRGPARPGRIASAPGSSGSDSLGETPDA